MCDPKRYGFWAIFVWNRVKILTNFALNVWNRNQVWKGYELFSRPGLEKGTENYHILVWNGIRVWRTEPDTLPKIPSSTSPQPHQSWLWFFFFFGKNLETSHSIWMWPFPHIISLNLSFFLRCLPQRLMAVRNLILGESKVCMLSKGNNISKCQELPVW